ncbi:hypothetical protein MASR2M66_28390 [Chloroflexota bacterium]
MDIVLNLITTLSRGTSGIFVGGLSLLLMLLALVRKDPPMMVLAAFLSIPAMFVMGSGSGAGIFVRFLPLFPLAGAYAIAQEDTLFSWLLPVPVLGMLIFFIFRLVMTGFKGV